MIYKHHIFSPLKINGVALSMSTLLPTLSLNNLFTYILISVLTLVEFSRFRNLNNFDTLKEPK